MGLTMTTEARREELGHTSKTILENCKLPGGLVCEAEGSIPDIYHKLGEVYGEKIREGVKSFRTSGDYDARKKRAISIHERLGELLDRTDVVGRSAFQYMSAIWAWSGGAGITIDEAIMLQDDNFAGCQTAMVRISKDRVVMVHSEEDGDVTNNMTVAPAVHLNIDGRQSVSVTYDKLLPGSATFGASEGFLVSCDFLRTKGVREGGGLVNTLSWMIWNLGNEASPEVVEELVTAMGPFNDAYAINIVRKVNEDRVEAYRLTVAGDRHILERVGDKPGDSLVQVSIIDPDLPRDEGVGKYSVNKDDLVADGKPDYWDGYINRIKRIQSLIRYFTKTEYLEAANKLGDREITEKLIDLMGAGASVPGDWGLVNSFCDVAGSAVVSGSGTNVILNVGPVIRGADNTRKEFAF